MNRLVNSQVAIDLTDVIATYSVMPSMWFYYSYYPLKEMIIDLYRLPPSPGHDEPFFENLRALTPWLFDLDGDMLQVFVESISMSIDSTIEAALGETIWNRTYSVIKWLEGNSILLNVNEHEIPNSDRLTAFIELYTKKS